MVATSFVAQGSGAPSFTPASAAIGDLAILVVTSGVPESLTPPVGWTTLYDTGGHSTSGFYAGRIRAYYRVLTSLALVTASTDTPASVSWSVTVIPNADVPGTPVLTRAPSSPISTFTVPASAPGLRFLVILGVSVTPGPVAPASPPASLTDSRFIATGYFGHTVGFTSATASEGGTFVDSDYDWGVLGVPIVISTPVGAGLSNADLERAYLLGVSTAPNEALLSNSDLRDIVYIDRQTPYASDPAAGLSATDVEISARRTASVNPNKQFMSLADLRREAWDTGGGGSPTDPSLLLHLDASDVASWPGSGSTWFDLTANNRDAAMTSMVYDAAGGGSMNFQGIGAATIPDDSGLALSTVGGTAMFFTRITGSGEAGFFDHGYFTGALGGYMFWYEGGRASVYIQKSARATSGVLPLATWMHLTMRWDGAEAAIYINGVSSVTGAAPFPEAVASSLLIGGYGGSLRLNGLMNDVRFFNRALTGPEILAQFDADKAKYGL